MAAASLARAATPTATVAVEQRTRSEKLSCELAIVAVDGRRLKSPQRQVKFSPGRHVLEIQVSFLLADSKGVPRPASADATLVQEFEAHRYSIHGLLSRTGGLRLRVTDEDKKREVLGTRKRR